MCRWACLVPWSRPFSHTFLFWVHPTTKVAYVDVEVWHWSLRSDVVKGEDYLNSLYIAVSLAWIKRFPTSITISQRSLRIMINHGTINMSATFLPCADVGLLPRLAGLLWRLTACGHRVLHTWGPWKSAVSWSGVLGTYDLSSHRVAHKTTASCVCLCIDRSEAPWTS